MSAPTSAPPERKAGVRQAQAWVDGAVVTPGSVVVVAVLRYIALVISAVLFLLPFYLIVRNAISLDTDITAPGWTLFPKQIHWENFPELFTDPSVNIVQGW